ncbi:MAG: polysaccharide biosynthesis/export family protein [Roseiarcus sp.]|jgi:polysaccharide export outer membrane protein
MIVVGGSGALMGYVWGRRAAIGAAILTLAGCTMIPDSGPSRRIVESEATATLGVSSEGSILDYALVDLNRVVLPLITDPGPGSLLRTFGAGHGPVPEIKVGVGDTIQVTLFEAQAGGLFIPTDAGARPGNFVSLPNQTVDSKGYITVPYAGQIRVLNRGTPAIQQDIINNLKNRAIEPQAVVSIVSQTSTEVTVVGDVNNPNKIAINPAGDRVLDAISRAGGIRSPGYEEFVTLQRHGLKGTVYFINLVKNPRENVFIEPGDTLYVYDYQRAFMAFGATGASGQFKFLQEDVTLSDAVGKAGGLLDSRAEPGQVFVYRIEQRSTLEQMGVDVSKFAEDRQQIPTIFRVNFRDPSGFFAARRFPMRDNDIIYVDNADQVEITKFLNMITTITGATSSVANDAASTKGSILYLENKCATMGGFPNCPTR